MLPPSQRSPAGLPLSVAPMMQRTDRHFRVFMRRITRRALLYSEMVTTAAVLHGDRDQLLGFSSEERPLSLQLGGDGPSDLARCARIAEERGYDEVNLNCGCPSDRVQAGRFGAVLMRRPERVAECVAAMRGAVGIPVTVKHRVGVDELDRYDDLLRFVEIVAAAGCRRFTVHARKAWLRGLSPQQNRTLPPLRREDVHRLKRDLPHLFIEVNGGLRTVDAVLAQLEHVDAAMIGRAAFEDPFCLVEADRRVFGDPRPVPTRHQIVEAMLEPIEAALARGARLPAIARHMLPLFRGQRGTRAWKRHLTEEGCRPGAGVEVVRAALARVPRDP